MRLIEDIDLKYRASEYCLSKDEYERFCKIIDAEPTAYDVDKVVEQLKTARDGYSTAQLMTATNDELVKRFIAKEKAMNLAIKIVKTGERVWTHMKR